MVFLGCCTSEDGVTLSVVKDTVDKIGLERVYPITLKEVLMFISKIVEEFR